MTILITGANGTVSSALLRTLSTRPDVKLRALVRDATKAPQLPGVEIAVGDLDRPETLGDAFAGVDALWLLTAMGPQAPHASSNAVWAARQAGVGHLVRLSAIGAAHDAPTRNGRLHALSDAEAFASGIPTTVLRPAFFAQNLLGAIQGGTLYHAFGDARLSPIDVRDIADVAAEILTRPQPHAGKAYTLTGPESVSMAEAATQIGEQLGATVGARTVPATSVVDGMLAAGFDRWIAEVSGLEYGAAYASGWADYTTPHVREVLGRPARTVAEFARDHAEHFSL
ncbi:MAG: NAD(P)H-binding protein [Hamadaea sp.]|nr:NAD(P)H-binding protein [Hamadaea sp.]